MELTPVKIRGKKRARTFPASNGSGSPPTSTPRKKRTITSGKPSSSSLPKKQAKPPTRLEALPTEVLLLIFRCADFPINLPLASPLLGAKLSSKQTYKEVCASAFPRNVSRALWFGPESGPGEEAKLQTEILQRRWCTLSLLEDVERIRKACMSDEDSESGGFPKEATPEVCGYPLVLAPGTMLPAKVLQGPWDSSKVAFLQFLLRRGAGVDWEYTSLGEVAKSGLYEAIRENNLVATGLLLHYRISITPPADLIRHAVINGGCNRSVVSALLRCENMESEGTIDSALWKWAQDARNSGRWQGEWLLKTLRLVAATGLPLSIRDEKADKRDDFIDIRSFWNQDLQTITPNP